MARLGAGLGEHDAELFSPLLSFLDANLPEERAQEIMFSSTWTSFYTFMNSAPI